MDPPQATEGPPQTYFHLLETLRSFLTVAIHSILYTRSLYPRTTFLHARAYNHPVYQSRHPGVCQWINHAVASVVEQVGRGAVRRLAVVVYAEQSGAADRKGKGEDGRRDAGTGEVMVLERFVFDLSRFPHVPEREDLHTEIERAPNGERGRALDLVNVEEQLRAAVGRLALVGGKLGPLPEGKECTFGLVIELKDEEENGEGGAPIGHPQPWIPSSPSQQPATGPSSTEPATKGGMSTAVRAVEAGEFVMEMWVEEGRAKFNHTGPP